MAGGSDSSGYLNAARLFSEGRVFTEIPIPKELSVLPSDRDVFLPLAFRPGPRPGTMAARYPPGLPLHMAAAALAGGWSRAPFLVIPLSAIAAIVVVFWIARELGLSRLFSFGGAALLDAFPRIRQEAERRGYRFYALLRDFEHRELARAPGNWTRLGNLRDVVLWRLD
ncbi:MAG TPA: hypothetical protein VKH43_07610 [Thermoanaerobaculia bacterium]|nr:hypothetical protein [Thermoanaerobaculia bacterium]